MLLSCDGKNNGQAVSHPSGLSLLFTLAVAMHNDCLAVIPLQLLSIYLFRGREQKQPVTLRVLLVCCSRGNKNDGPTVNRLSDALLLLFSVETK